jgi:hypothetical protein
MVLEQALETIAHSVIPEGVHEVLHIDCRDAWVKTVSDMVEKRMMPATTQNIKKLANGWETLLYLKYSSLN